MKITLPNVYSQLDPKYSGAKIGTSTIGAIGCLTADAAMTACYFGHYETPSSLAGKIKYSGNYYIWSELSRLYPDIKYSHSVNMNDYNDPLTDIQMAEIKKAIDAGYPVFIKIITPKIPEHWLLGVDYNGDDIFVADPLKGTVHAITDYGIAPREVIYAYGWYTGNPMNVSNNDPLQVCLAEHRKAVEAADAKDREIVELKKDYEKLTISLQTQIDGAVAEEHLKCQQQLSKDREDLMVEFNHEKGLLEKEIEELKEEGVKVYVEKPLSERYVNLKGHDRTKKKINDIMEILTA